MGESPHQTNLLICFVSFVNFWINKCLSDDGGPVIGLPFSFWSEP